MNKVVNNLIKQGFEVTKQRGSDVFLKNHNGSVVHIKDNGKIEGIINSRVDSDFSLNEGKTTLGLSMFVLLGVSTTYFTTDFTIFTGESMSPTYKNMEVIINSKFDPTDDMISRDCVVKFIDYSGDRCIKRVVGMPGDKVESSKDGMLKINGRVIDKETFWILPKGIQISDDGVSAGNGTENYTLGAHEYFVMGDNRENSVDSRSFGPVHKTNIIRVVSR